MNVEYHGYRPWAKQIESNLKAVKTEAWHITEEKPQVSLFYGWSWRVPTEVFEDHLCLLLHPSPLPKYRGGSPLQHQIINGESTSAVTILQVAEKVDSGNIYSQTPFSLDGTLNDIFRRMVNIGTVDTINVLNSIADGTIQPVPQDHTQATTYKRRKPEQSLITIDDIKTKTAKQLYDFVRALADPYPNAYIECGDGKRLYLSEAHLESLEELKATS